MVSVENQYFYNRAFVIGAVSALVTIVLLARVAINEATFQWMGKEVGGLKRWNWILLGGVVANIVALVVAKYVSPSYEKSVLVNEQARTHELQKGLAQSRGEVTKLTTENQDQENKRIAQAEQITYDREQNKQNQKKIAELEGRIAELTGSIQSLEEENARLKAAQANNVPPSLEELAKVQYGLLQLIKTKTELESQLAAAQEAAKTAGVDPVGKAFQAEASNTINQLRERNERLYEEHQGMAKELRETNQTMGDLRIRLRETEGLLERKLEADEEQERHNQAIFDENATLREQTTNAFELRNLALEESAAQRQVIASLRDQIADLRAGPGIQETEILTAYALRDQALADKQKLLEEAGKQDEQIARLSRTILKLQSMLDEGLSIVEV